MAYYNYLNQEIEVWRSSKSENNFGKNIKNYVLNNRIFGYIDFMGGSKNKISGQWVEKCTHVLMSIVDVDIKVTDKIKYDGKEYNILYCDLNIFDHHSEIFLEYLEVS